jgi:hypothetical protein
MKKQENAVYVTDGSINKTSDELAVSSSRVKPKKK